MGLSDNFFHTVAIFFLNGKKCKIDCSVRKLRRSSLRPFGQNNGGISKNFY